MGTQDDPPQGIGGWLILVAAGIIVAPFKILIETVQIYLPIFTDGTWEVLTDPSSIAYVPFFGSVVVLEILANLGFAVFGFLLTFLFFSKSGKFPKLFIVFMLSSLAFTLFDAWLSRLVFPEEPMFDPETAGGFARQILVCLIWVPYMVVSKRVEATFTRSRHAPGPQPEKLEIVNPWKVPRSSPRKAIMMGGAVAVGLLVLTIAGIMAVAALHLAFERSTIESVSFDTTGWQEQAEDRTEDFAVWLNSYGDMLSLAVGPPDDIDISDPDAVFEFARDFVASQDGGLVSCELIEIDANPAIEVIYKQEHGLGYLYKGLIFCPMELRTLLFNAIFSEHGTTGVREAVVSAELFEAGQLEIDFETVSDEGGSHPIPGWFFDPYDPEFEGVVLNSISDDVKYDEMFPGHPLTELRRVFEKVRGTAVVEALYR